MNNDQGEEILKRLRRIETRQYRHAQLQGLDITDRGDKVRVQYDGRNKIVMIDNVDISLSLILKTLHENGITQEVDIYMETKYIGSVDPSGYNAPAEAARTGSGKTRNHKE